MDGSRRDVLKAGVGCIAAAASGSQLGCGGSNDPGRSKSQTEMPPLDYGRSFICHTAPENSVRFWVESRTRIVDEKQGTVSDFYQCGSCKSEHTFAVKDLLVEDNYDFLPIFGDGSVLIFRRHAYVSERYRSVTPSTKMLWGPPTLALEQASGVAELTSWDEIQQATAKAVPLVTQTELRHESTGLRAIIECPTKTMNISHTKKMYQVDTGPVAYPDLSRSYSPRIESLSLAFLVFNAPHFADFVVEQPTSIPRDSGEKCQVYHYSRPFSLPAKNRLFAVGGA